MKKNILKALTILSIILPVFISCSDREETILANSGRTRSGIPINYSNYVAIGDGVTAGLQDNVWYKEAQDNSVAVIFSQKLQDVNLGAVIVNPSVTTQGTGVPDENGEVNRYSKGSWVVGEARILTEAVPSIVGTTADGSGFTNISVIKAKMEDLTKQNYSAENPYFSYFSSSDTASMLGEAKKAIPTFTTISVGKFDLLDYALNKGTNDALVLPSSATLENQVDVVASVFSTQQGGAVIGIDVINDLPYFNHVRNSINLEESTANAINEGIDSLVYGLITHVFDSIQVVTRPKAQDSIAINFLEPIMIDGWGGKLGVSSINACCGYDIPNRPVLPPSKPTYASCTTISTCTPIVDSIAYNIVFNGPYYSLPYEVSGVKTGTLAGRVAAISPSGRSDRNDYIFAEVDKQWVYSFENDSTTAMDSIMATDPLQVMVIEKTFTESIASLLLHFGEREALVNIIANQLFNVVLRNVEGELTPESLDAAIDNSLGEIGITVIDVLRNRKYFPEFVAGDNPLFVIDPSSPTRMRVLETGDKIMLPYANVYVDLRTFIKSIVSNGGLPGDFDPSNLLNLFPTIDQVYFYTTQQEVAEANRAYNLALSNAANSNRWAFVNVESISTKLITGYKQDGVTYTNEYRSGNFYSMDGHSYTSAANAIIVNEMIETLNTLYSSTIPKVTVKDYPGN
ncbi:hypothetical protein EI427_15585 [Flammeovirga pectinis]|uniref:Uncharacterized protein n=1 Tax=Flammeovirga pectinis TaxID=2494373 RepID=A0A3S9P694_9BACT|nr:hypothetical protein [Flammeovirga pectinis]AZQ63592.1 hypothetical protein EI427_15585 [Flammeovirga pectinis]